MTELNELQKPSEEDKPLRGVRKSETVALRRHQFDSLVFYQTIKHVDSLATPHFLEPNSCPPSSQQNNYGRDRPPV